MLVSLRFSARTLVFALLACLVLGTGLAQEARNLVVYPFSSQETLLGTAVADGLARALEDRLEVVGPELAPLLVPFLATEEGFISPLVFLDTPYDVATPDGARLLRGAFGADAVVTGEVLVRDTRLELLLYVATGERVRRYLLQASLSEPGRLASGALRAVEDALALAPEPADLTFDLSTAYADYVRALVLLGAGYAGEAAEALEQALAAPEASESWQRLLDEIRSVQEGEEAQDPYLQAALTLSLASMGEARAEEAFVRLAEGSSLPSMRLWVALLRRSQGDVAGADSAFEAALDPNYPFAAAAHALQLARREPEGARALLAGLEDAPMAAALVGSLAAGALGDLALERALLEGLGRRAPTFVYSFERRSFIAFEEGDALAAAQALVVATRLAPESDLYWTNLGWAYYLLGFLDRSEAASLRALRLDDGQVVAWYNLGLVQTVTGRLADAVQSYNAALLRDEGVNEEAIEDLEEALRLYPEEPGVHFALASLYAADGRRSEAAREFERYLERAPAHGDPVLLSQAERRLAELTAPPPAIILGEGRLSPRPGLAAETVYGRGERVFAGIELTTDGFELPRELEIDLRLLSADGEAVMASSSRREVPAGAVALRLDDLGLNLPTDLAEGSYELEIVVTASEDREVRQTLAFEVRGEAPLARQLASRGITLRTLEGAPLLSPQVAALEDADAHLLAAMQGELQETAELAEEVLPTVASGRFEGLDGGALFLQSSEADLRDFLRFALAQEGLMESAFTFVDAYAQWALEGAPTPEAR